MTINQEQPRILSWRSCGLQGTSLAVVFFFLFSLLEVSSRAYAQTPAIEPSLEIKTIPLTEGSDAGTLTLFRPAAGNGTSVVIAPGGGYQYLSMNAEGRDVADWFASRGVAAFVLKYRLGPNHLFPIPLEDAQRAIRLVRSLADRYYLAPDRIGFVGFSAGGHLAAAAGTLFHEARPDAPTALERLSDRPDFLILAYPWLNAMQPNNRGLITYCGNMKVVPPDECIADEKQYTPLLHVTKGTPPSFIYITSDDSVVSVPSAIAFYNALYDAGVSAELHVFQHGMHGSSLGYGNPTLEEWPVLLEHWLRDRGLLTSAPGSAWDQLKSIGPAPAWKPGERLTVDSRVEDLLSDPHARAVIARVCGESFLTQLPDFAKVMSLRTNALLGLLGFDKLDKDKLEEIADNLARR